MKAMSITALLMILTLVALTNPSTALGQQSQQSDRKSRLSTSQVAQQVSASVVTISSSRSVGSGVIIDPTGVIATSLHVITDASELSVKLANGDQYNDISIIDFDERKDLVILKIKAFSLSSATLGNSEQVRQGDKVILIGSPQGLDRSVSDGVISAIRDSGDGYRVFQTSAAASSGSSGGGMFNEYAELIGIVCYKLEKGENINFALPINYYRGLISTRPAMTLAELALKLRATVAAPTQSATSTSSISSSANPNVERLRILLDGTGYKYTKTSDDTWRITFEGENNPSMVVYLSTLEDLVLIQSYLPDSEPTPTKMTQMLQMSFSANLAKVGVDQDKDIYALQESEIRLLDASGLKRLIQAVVSLADDLSGISSPQSEYSSMPSLKSSPQQQRYALLSLLSEHAEIRYDSNAWKPDKSEDPSPGEYYFVAANGDIYIRIISERIEIPLDKMADFALENAKSVDPNTKVTRQAWRNVNGQRCLYLEMEATIKGIPFIFIGHYFSDSSGTIQIMGYTSRNLTNEFRPLIDAFISGLQVSAR
jgi:hypothetical protein